MLLLPTLAVLAQPDVQIGSKVSPTAKLKPDYTEAQIQAMAGKLASKIEALRKSTLDPGVEVVIVKNDKVVFLKAFGYRDLEKRLPMTVNTQTMIASCSKAFNATVVMMAADEGKLKLDAHPRDYLPYFKLKDPEANEKITVWDLMNHVSGLPRTDTAGFTYGLTSEEWVRSIADAEPTFRYRENEQYSNVLVHTAGMIAAQVEGKSWPDLVRDRIFLPLGMTHSSAQPYSTLSEMAVPYDVDPTNGAVRKVPYMEVQSWGAAAGGIKSTASDLAQWLRVQLNHGKLGDQQVIAADIIDREHESRMKVQPLLEAASGWFIDHSYGFDVIGHGGALEGFLTNVMLVPERHLGMAVLTNSRGSGQAAITAMLRTELLGDSGIKDLNDFQFNARGLYTNSAYDKFQRLSFLSETGALSINEPGKSKIRLDHVPPVLLPGLGTPKHLYTDANNQKAGVSLAFFKEDISKNSFQLVTSSKTESYHLATDKPSHRLISTRELEQRELAAYGGAKNVLSHHSFRANFTNDYVNEGLKTNGHWYHEWPHNFAVWENYTAFGKKLGSSQAVTTPRASLFAATFLETQKTLPFEPPYLSNAMRFCDAGDWSQLYNYVRIVGTSMLHGEPVYVVLKHPRFPTHALDVVDYVSQKTNYVLRRELGPLDSPEDYSQAWEFADFKMVEGVRVPTTITNIDTGEHRVVTRLSKLEAVERLPSVYFTPGDFKGEEAVYVTFR